MPDTAGSAAEPQTEVELKLLTDERAAKRLWSHKAVKALCQGEPKTRRIRTAYYDTPNQDLMRGGCALRIRSCDGKFEQHLKTAGTAEGGLFHRQEWRAAIAADAPDFAAWSGEPAEWLAPFRKTLRRLFESDMERTTAILSNGIFAVELALDIGTIRAFDAEGGIFRETPLVEIELELQSGPAVHVYDLALDLAAALPLRLGWQSKAERGYNLVLGTPPQPRRAVAPEIASGCTTGRGIAAILGETMTHFLANQPSVEDTDDPEAVHQMRVSCRRLRAALALFRPLLPASETAACRDGFRDLATRLGEVRDLDVLLSESLLPVISAGEVPTEIRDALSVAVHAVEARRDERLAEARAIVAAPETARLLLGLGRRIMMLRQTNETALAAPIDAFADSVLRKRHRAVTRLGRRLHAISAQERHALRIAAKKLRYAAEFFQAMYPGKEMRNFLKNLSDLQDDLGSLNDISTAPKLLTAVAGSSPAMLTAAGFVLGWHTRRTRATLDDAAETCRNLRNVHPFKTRAN